MSRIAELLVEGKRACLSVCYFANDRRYVSRTFRSSEIGRLAFAWNTHEFSPRILTVFSRGQKHPFPACRSSFPFIFIGLYYMILFPVPIPVWPVFLFSHGYPFAHGRVRIYYTIRSEIARGEFDPSSPFSSSFQTLRLFPIVLPFFFILRTPYTFHCGLAVYRARVRMYGGAKYCGEYGSAPFIICRWFASV